VSDWKSEFTNVGAVWLHDGKPERPHAVLTSGLKTQLPTQKIDWVIGSALGAVTFAFAVGEALGARAGFTEKDADAMRLARFELKPGERVLVVEDVISTGGSTLKTIAGLKAASAEKAELLPYVVCLVNRSGQKALEGFEIRALLTLDIHTWKSEECPLCKAGSEAVRPKTHWKELTGR
jgi:orotate phosphoribosyltransferase